MDEPKPLNDVAKFHMVFDLPMIENPVIPSKDRCELRINLIEEELEELKAAIAENDLVEVADAFCDLQYVLSGAILEFGLGGRFKELFEEVQRSNMSKACKTMEEAQQTLEYYKKKKDTNGYIKPKDGVFLVYREEDGKVLKSINYSPARVMEMLK
jgi:predicted HAD superfamily Cof-like phosphohydrolase